MPVTDLLRRNAREHGNEVALVELNPSMEDMRRYSFKEYDLVPTVSSRYAKSFSSSSEKDASTPNPEAFLNCLMIPEE